MGVSIHNQGYEHKGEDRGGWLWWVIPVAIGLGARVVLAATLPIMFDEAWSIKQAADVSPEMFLGREGDASPPLSYLLFAGWGLVSRSIGWFRLLSIVLSLASIYPIALAARRLFGEGAVRPSVWILAVWPLPLYAGWNIRYYALLLLVSALYLLCWIRPLTNERILPERPIVTSVLEVLLFHTTYTSLPLIVALNGYGIWRLLRAREWQALARWGCRGFVVIILCIPQYLVYRHTAAGIASVIGGYASLGLLPDLVVAAKAMILTELPYWHDVALRPLWLLPVLVYILVGMGLRKKGRVAIPPLIVVFSTVLLVAIGIGSGVRQLGQYYFQVLPLVAVLVGAGLSQLPRSVQITTTTLVAWVTLLRLVDPSYHYAFSDTRSVANIVDRVDPSTPVVYLDNVLRAFTDATQFSRPRTLAIITVDAAEQDTSGVRGERWWSDPVVYDRPLQFQPATRVYAERWSRQRWNMTLTGAGPREVYLVVPVQSRGTAVVRTEAIGKGRQAADSILTAGKGVWQISELQFPGTLIYHLRRQVRTSE